MSSSNVRRTIENDVPWSWQDWMGITGPRSAQHTADSGNVGTAPDFQPEEANALYREVFDALQVPKRLSGARRVRRGSFEIVNEIFPAQFFSGDFVSVFDSDNATFLA